MFKDLLPAKKRAVTSEGRVGVWGMAAIERDEQLVCRGRDLGG